MKRLREQEVFVPEGWDLVELQDVCHTITDGTHKTPNYQNAGVRFISIKNVRPFKPINWDSYERYISVEEHLQLIKRCRPEPDDVLFPRIGTLGFAKRIDFEEEVSLFVGLGLLKTNKELVDPRYLEYYMNSPLIYRLSHLRATGSGRLTLPLAATRKFPFPLPPRTVQEAIVGKIEELFSDLDAGVAALERAKANLKRYRAAVLKAAVEGKLTEEWRKEHSDVEPGSELLERILVERRKNWEEEQLAKYEAKGKKPPKGWKERYKNPVGPDTAGLKTVPEGWCWATIDQLTAGDRSVAYGVLQPGPHDPDGVPLVRVGDIADGKVDTDQLKHIAPEISDKYQRTLLRGGEVLLTVVGTIGRTAIAPNSLSGANTARAVAVLPVSGLVSSCWVEVMLRDPRMRRQLTRAAHEVARKTLNLEDVRTVSFPLAPMSEQGQVIAQVDAHCSVADAVESQVETDVTRSISLRQSVLARAFAGELVRSDDLKTSNHVRV